MITQREIDLAIKNGVVDKVYPVLVQELINEKYSIYDELAIQRQRNTKKAEFNEYNAYCEDCKARAKELLEIEPVTED